MEKQNFNLEEALKTQNVTDFKAIAEECVRLYARKNHDYGNSFDETMNEWGPVAGLIRLSDKFKRLKELHKNHNNALVKDESMTDTLMDIVCYSIMILANQRRHEQNK